MNNINSQSGRGHYIVQVASFSLAQGKGEVQQSIQWILHVRSMMLTLFKLLCLSFYLRLVKEKHSKSKLRCDITLQWQDPTCHKYKGWKLSCKSKVHELRSSTVCFTSPNIPSDYRHLFVLLFFFNIFALFCSASSLTAFPLFWKIGGSWRLSSWLSCGLGAH